MNAATIKWLDRKMGIPICFSLSLLNFSRPGSFVPTKKLVFIKLIEQGASVLAYSALKYSVQKYGKQNVYFLVFSDGFDIISSKSIV